LSVDGLFANDINKTLSLLWDLVKNFDLKEFSTFPIFNGWGVFVYDEQTALKYYSNFVVKLVNKSQSLKYLEIRMPLGESRLSAINRMPSIRKCSFRMTRYTFEPIVHYDCNQFFRTFPNALDVSLWLDNIETFWYRIPSSKSSQIQRLSVQGFHLAIEKFVNLKTLNLFVYSHEFEKFDGFLGKCKNLDLKSLSVALYFGADLDRFGMNDKSPIFDLIKWIGKLPTNLKVFHSSVSAGFYVEGNQLNEDLFFETLGRRLPNLEVLMLEGFKIPANRASSIASIFGKLKIVLSLDDLYPEVCKGGNSSGGWKCVGSGEHGRVKRFREFSQFDDMWVKARFKYL
jgi:hypothetical protein